VLIETAVNAALSAVLSAGFVWLVFGGRNLVPLWGRDGVAFDQLPMTFMIAFMMTLGLTLYTRSRCAKGAAPRHAGGPPLPRWLPLRALAIALLLTLVLVPASVGLLALSGKLDWRFVEVMALKIVYGAVVAAVATPLIVLGAMRDGHRASPRAH